MIGRDVGYVTLDRWMNGKCKECIEWASLADNFERHEKGKQRLNTHLPEEIVTATTQLTNEQHFPHHTVGDVGGYLQKGYFLPQAQHRVSQDAGDLRPKVRIRSMSDIGVTQRSAALDSLERAASRESAMVMGTGLHTREPMGVANGEMGTLDTRVSVAKLRHSYLENASGHRPELYVNWHVSMLNQSFIKAMIKPTNIQAITPTIGCEVLPFLIIWNHLCAAHHLKV